MPQTLLALLSMVVTTVFAFNQHRSVLVTRMNMVKQDMSIRSTGVAIDLLEEIGSMAFDEATKSGEITADDFLTTVDHSETAYSNYVSEESAGGQTGEPGGIDDIDDFNKIRVLRTRERNGFNLGFAAFPRVSYVQEDGITPSSYPTKHKKVTLAIASADYAFADTIYLSQVFSCGSRCAW